MILNLKRAGKLSNLAGLIVGGMSKMNDNAVPFGKTAEEIIAEAVSEYGYPVAFGFPAGHTAKNLALVMGRNVRLEVGLGKTSLAFEQAGSGGKVRQAWKRLLKPVLFISGFFILLYLVYMLLMALSR
jgi:muramoyltetrapeptide carboxypeptidase